MGVYTNMAANYVNKIGDNPVLESLQFSLDMQKADHAMFEALIELDFDEVYQEAGLSVYTEAEAKSGRKFSLKAIKDKVVAYINKFINMVKQFAAKIIAKIQDIFNKDKKLVKKYGEDFAKNAANYVFKAEQEIPFFAKVFGELKTLADGDVLGKQSISSILTTYKNAGTIDDVESYKQNNEDFIKEKIDKYKAQKFGEYFNKIPEKGKLGNDQISGIKKFMDIGLLEFIRAIKAEAKKVEADLNTSKKYYEGGEFAAERSSYDKDDKDAIAVSSAIGKASLSTLSLASTLNTTMKNFDINLIKKAYADIRKIFVAASRESKKEENSEAVNASYEYTLGVLSDTYIEEAFA